MLRKRLLTSAVLSILCLCVLVPAASAQGRLELRTFEGIQVLGGQLLDLGSVPVGGYIDKTFRITNVGTMPIVLGTPAVLLSPNSPFFIRVPPHTNYLAPTFSTEFTVRFISPSPDTITNSLLIKYSDSQNQFVFTFYLQATALGAAMMVTPPENFLINPNSTYTFPTTTPGVPVSREFRIYNPGNLPLTISNFTLSTTGGFSVLVYPPTTPESIDPKQAATFRIRLLGVSPGTKTGTVTFNTNVAGLSPFQFFLQGTVAAPDIRVVSQDGVTLTNGSLVVMPSTRVSTAISSLFTIHNDGNAPLIISNPASLVSGQGYFLIVQPPSRIDPGNNGVFRVRLISPTAGTYSGTVTIQSNDPDESPLSFSLRGTVTP